MDFSLLLLLLMLVLFVPFFLTSRRQRRQFQALQEMQASLEPGDVVITTSGLRATVVDASYEDTLDLEIADGVVTTWLRGAIREKVAVPAVGEVPATEETPAATEAAPKETADTAASDVPREKGESTNDTSRG